MRVIQTRRLNTARTGRAARSSGVRGGEFQIPAGSTAVRRTELAGPTAVGSIDTIVALQAVEEPSERRRKAVQNGGKILDLLDKLKIGLLSGGVRTEDLNSLKKTIGHHRAIESDPGLNDVLRQIDLRARVELAKLKGKAA